MSGLTRAAMLRGDLEVEARPRRRLQRFEQPQHADDEDARDQREHEHAAAAVRPSGQRHEHHARVLHILDAGAIPDQAGRTDDRKCAGEALADDDDDDGADDREKNLCLNDVRGPRHDVGADRANDAERGAEQSGDGEHREDRCATDGI